MLTLADRRTIVSECPEVIVDQGPQAFFRSLRMFTNAALIKAYNKGVEDSRLICVGDLTGVGYADEIERLKHEDSRNEDPPEQPQSPAVPA